MESKIFPKVVNRGTGIIGSWYITLNPKSGTGDSYYGHLRISKNNKYQLSCDLYSAEPTFFKLQNGTCFPNFSKSDYCLYFYDEKIDIAKSFTAAIKCFDWEYEKFRNAKKGVLRMEGALSLVNISLLKGELTIGNITWNVDLKYASNFFRGCLLEILEGNESRWIETSNSCFKDNVSVQSIYQKMSLNLEPYFSKRKFDEININNSILTNSDCNYSWQLLVIVDKHNGVFSEDLYGVMFDGKPPVREGFIIFSDPLLPSYNLIRPDYRGQPIGKAPHVFIRTVAHEIGHALNLPHPNLVSKRNNVTIMNITEEVIKSAKRECHFPCNAVLEFEQGELSELIHAPDCQIMPGWKKYGWWWEDNIVPKRSGSRPVSSLSITLENPKIDEIIPAKSFLWVNVIIKNTSEESSKDIMEVHQIFDGFLSFNISLVDVQNDRDFTNVQNIFIPCRDLKRRTLKPGEEIIFPVQLFSTNHGRIFDNPGKYSCKALLKIIDTNYDIDSKEIYLEIKKEDEHISDKLNDPQIDIAFSLGQITGEENVKKSLVKIANAGSGDTSLACQLILANSGFNTAGEKDSSNLISVIEGIKSNFGVDRVRQIAVSIFNPISLHRPLMQKLIRDATTEQPVIGDQKSKDLMKLFQFALKQ